MGKEVEVGTRIKEDGRKLTKKIKIEEGGCIHHCNGNCWAIEAQRHWQRKGNTEYKPTVNKKQPHLQWRMIEAYICTVMSTYWMLHWNWIDIETPFYSMQIPTWKFNLLQWNWMDPLPNLMSKNVVDLEMYLYLSRISMEHESARKWGYVPSFRLTEIGHKRGWENE